MDDNDLMRRGRAMEEAFFSRENERLRRALRAAPAALMDTDELGIDDAARILDGARARHLDSGMAAAMLLVPLVAVAWADRSLHEAERKALLQAAADSGIRDGSPSHDVLATWLEKQPDPELFESWKSFIVAYCADMDATAVENLRSDLVGRARHVAEAAGGILGIGRISGREQEVLSELADAFPA